MVDDEPLTRAELLAAMAQAVGRKRVRAVPAFLTHLAVGPEVVAIGSRSQRVSNRKFKEATGWTPQVVNAAEAWQLVVAYALASLL